MGRDPRLPGSDLRQVLCQLTCGMQVIDVLVFFVSSALPTSYHAEQASSRCVLNVCLDKYQILECCNHVVNIFAVGQNWLVCGRVRRRCVRETRLGRGVVASTRGHHVSEKRLPAMFGVCGRVTPRIIGAEQCWVQRQLPYLMPSA